MQKIALTQEQRLARKEETIRKWVIQQMRINGITQIQLADYMGFSKDTVSRRLRNGILPLRYVIAVATLSNTEPDELKKVLTL